MSSNPSLISVRPEMVFLALLIVLRGFPAAAYRRTPHRKPLCGLDQNQKSTFLNWAHADDIIIVDGDCLKESKQSRIKFFSNETESDAIFFYAG